MSDVIVSASYVYVGEYFFLGLHLKLYITSAIVQSEFGCFRLAENETRYDIFR